MTVRTWLVALLEFVLVLWSLVDEQLTATVECHMTDMENKIENDILKVMQIDGGG